MRSTRYTIESVSVVGPVHEEFCTQIVRDQMQALIGDRLDSQNVERLGNVLAQSVR